jgi:hypothetical protein
MTLAANGLLVQSADHRLIRVKDGSVYDDSEPKHLFAQSMGGQASFISFAGVGEVPGRGRASKVLYRAVSEPLDSKASFEDIAEAVREAGTHWLRSVRGDRRHSFTMAGFHIEDQKVETRIALISNWQRVGTIERSRVTTTDAADASNDFAVTWMDEWDDGEPVLLTTGLSDAVHDGDALRLTQLVRRRRTLEGLSRAVAHVNRTAAGRSSGISPHCTTVSLVIGRTQVNGISLGHSRDGEQEVPIPSAMTGFDLRSVLGDAVAEIWEKEGLTGVPQVRPSSTFGASLPFRTEGSPFANPSDRFLT